MEFSICDYGVYPNSRKKFLVNQNQLKSGKMYMLKSRKYLVLVVMALFAGTGFFMINAQNSPQQNDVTARKGGLPSEIVYLVLINELKELKDKDSSNQAQGSPTQFKKSFLQGKFGLTDSAMVSVDSIAGNYFNQIRTLDDRAQQLITEYRSNYPNGELKKKQVINPNSVSDRNILTEQLPPTPNELKQMQIQKNQLVTQAKNEIKLALGNTAFSKFDSALQENAEETIIPLNLYTHDPVTIPTPEN